MGKRKLAQLLDSEDENEEGPVLSKEDQVGAEEEVGEEEKYVKEGEEAMAAVNVAVGSAGVNEGEKEKEKETSSRKLVHSIVTSHNWPKHVPQFI